MNVLITGASKGVGAALVKHFAAHTDATIIALARDIELLKTCKIFVLKHIKNPFMFIMLI